MTTRSGASADGAGEQLAPASASRSSAARPTRGMPGQSVLREPALERAGRDHPHAGLVEPRARSPEAAEEVGGAVVVRPVGGERDVVGRPELERDPDVRPLAGLDRDHPPPLEDLHGPGPPPRGLQASERLAMLLEALE